MIDYEALFRAERAKVEELEETLRQLMEEAVAPQQAIAQVRWPVYMTPAEKAVCLTLLASDENRFATVEQLSTAISGSAYAYARPYDDFQVDNKVKVYICRVRKKLKPFAVKVINVWSKGYYIPKDCIEAWKSATEGLIQ